MEQVIHYCWFGGNDLSPVASASIESWKNYAPGLEIKLWNEDNFDIEQCEFSKDAYKSGKWAFVSDYARFKILHEFGGIYMDVGTELIKDITPLLNTVPFSAIEEISKTATPGLIAACHPKDEIVEIVVSIYESLKFLDENSYLAEHTVNKIFTSVLEDFGFCRDDVLQKVADWTIYPSAYFDPVYGFRGFHCAESTYAVHHSSGSWLDPKFSIKRKFVEDMAPYIGRRPAQVIGRVLAEFKQEGISGGLKNIGQVAHNAIRNKHAG